MGTVCDDVYTNDKAVNKPKYHVPYKSVEENVKRGQGKCQMYDQ